MNNPTYNDLSANFNEVPFCLLDGPMNLVFYLETSYNSKQYQLVFYKHLILSVIKKFAYMIKAYPAENSIIIKTYAKPYNMEILFDQIWSLPSQFFSQVFEIIISQLGSAPTNQNAYFGHRIENQNKFESRWRILSWKYSWSVGRNHRES